MSVSYAPTRLRIPPGFEHVLEGLTREVLRDQPDDIVQYAADYFQKKLELRNETGVDPTQPSVIARGYREQAPQEEEADVQPHPTVILPTTEPAAAADVIDIDLKDPKVIEAAGKIQASFRSHLAKGKAQADASPSGDKESVATATPAPAMSPSAPNKAEEVGTDDDDEVAGVKSDASSDGQEESAVETAGARDSQDAAVEVVIASGGDDDDDNGGSDEEDTVVVAPSPQRQDNNNDDEVPGGGETAAAEGAIEDKGTPQQTDITVTTEDKEVATEPSTEQPVGEVEGEEQAVDDDGDNKDTLEVQPLQSGGDPDPSPTVDASDDGEDNKKRVDQGLGDGQLLETDTSDQAEEPITPVVAPVVIAVDRVEEPSAGGSSERLEPVGGAETSAEGSLSKEEEDQPPQPQEDTPQEDEVPAAAVPEEAPEEDGVDSDTVAAGDDKPTVGETDSAQEDNVQEDSIQEKDVEEDEVEDAT